VHPKIAKVLGFGWILDLIGFFGLGQLHPIQNPKLWVFLGAIHNNHSDKSDTWSLYKTAWRSAIEPFALHDISTASPCRNTIGLFEMITWTGFSGSVAGKIQNVRKKDFKMFCLFKI
jgi:hypothetical protein